jgi:steroid 5-alpha reductase family enzyme
LFLLFLGIEMTADEQQYLFQTEKYCLLKYQQLNSSTRQQSSGRDDYRRGFLTSGLFKYSRHPNFFAEMGIWWSVYLFSVSSTISLTESLQEQPVQWYHFSTYMNWTLAGPVTLAMLFQGSTWLTEVSKKKKKKGGTGMIDFIFIL